MALVASRYVILTWVFVEVLCFSGIVFGWAAIVFVLIDEGVHSELCPAADNVTFVTNQSEHVVGDFAACVDRDVRFNLYFMLMNGLSVILILVLGHIFSTYGTRRARICCIAVFWTGCLLFYFTSKDTPWLILPAIICLHASGLSFLITSVQVSKLFPTYGGLVIGILNGAVDSSCVTALLLKFLYQLGVPRQWTILGFMASSLMTVFSTFVLFPATYIDSTDSSTAHRASEQAVTHDAVPDDNEQNKGRLCHHLKDRIYLCHLFWFSIGNLSIMHFIGIANPVIVRKTGGNAKQGDVSVRSSQLRGTVFPLLLTSAFCGAIYCLLMIDEPRVMYVAFVDVTIARTFVYAAACMALMEMFPVRSFGILHSFALTLVGVVCQAQTALFYWSESYPGAFLHMNIFLSVLGFLSMLYPAYVFKKARAERKPCNEPTSGPRTVYVIDTETTRL